MKICKKCKVEKELINFNQSSQIKSGYLNICKECRYGHKPHKPILEGLKICITCLIPKELNYYSNIISKGKTYKQSSCNTCRNKIKELKYINNIKYKIKKSKNSHASKLKSKYNIDITMYNQMLKDQNNVCKICQLPETHKDTIGNNQRLSVDHCHSTNVVRGLLCKSCNSGLGQFKDSSKLLTLAIEYLKISKTDKSLSQI